MIVILDLTPTQKAKLLDVLASHRDTGPPGFEWQSKQLSTLRHKVETQIRYQDNNDPDRAED